MSQYDYRTLNTIRNAKLETLVVVSKAIGLKSPYTEKHSGDMVNTAAAVAKKLGLAPGRIEIVKYGTLLHDIGKLAIPDAILNKPGKLEPSEFDEMKKHPQVGYELIKTIYEPIGEIVRDHHEKVNGEGYPSGLKNDEISLETKIVAVADVYDALISERPYKKPFNKNKALKAIAAGIGTHFDADVAICFIEVITNADY